MRGLHSGGQLVGANMDGKTEDEIASIGSFRDLERVEQDLRRKDRLGDAERAAIEKRAFELGRIEVREKAGIDLSSLSPAEERIVQAVSVYAAISRRKHSNSSRTFGQLHRRGLLGAAETAVMKKEPTKGFSALVGADREDLSYEQIIVDHPEEFSARARWYARRTLMLPNTSKRAPAAAGSAVQLQTEGLIRWLQTRSEQNGGLIPPYQNAEAALALGMSLSESGRAFGNIQSRTDFACYLADLPPLGLTAEKPFARAWGHDEREWAYPIAAMQTSAREHVWKEEEFKAVLDEASGLPGQAHLIWKDEDDAKIRAWAFSLDAEGVVQGSQASIETIPSHPDTEPYWVFVCNPKRWNIDQFLERRIEHDTWDVRPSDRSRFAPGQLGIMRVGVDHRSIKQRNGRPVLEAGIYAICEVESGAFDGASEHDEFWAPGEGHRTGWPAVKLRYLQTYEKKPLTIEALRVRHPDLSKLLLNGFQGATFPISAAEFHSVTAMLGYDFDALPAPSAPDLTAARLAALEEMYLKANPEVREKASICIERGPVGQLLKRAVGFKCQLCEALGRPPFGFLKPNGEPYVEAHHVMPVSKREVGSLAASNVMILCANHHRQIHYGGIAVVIGTDRFDR